MIVTHYSYRRKINLEINLAPEESASNLFQHREGQLMPALLLWIFFSFLFSSQHQYAYKTNKPLLQLQCFQTCFQHFPLWGFVLHHLLSCWYSFIYTQYAGHTLNTPGKPGSELQTEKPAFKDKPKRKHLLFPVVQFMPWKKCIKMIF